MNDLMLRAAVGSQIRAQRAAAFVASKTRNENGEVNIVFVLVGIVIVLGILALLYTGVIRPRLDQASRCSTSIGTVVGGGTGAVDCN